MEMLRKCGDVALRYMVSGNGLGWDSILVIFSNHNDLVILAAFMAGHFVYSIGLKTAVKNISVGF